MLINIALILFLTIATSFFYFHKLLYHLQAVRIFCTYSMIKNKSMPVVMAFKSIQYFIHKEWYRR